jgi:hypothetical protein
MCDSFRVLKSACATLAATVWPRVQLRLAAFMKSALCSLRMKGASGARALGGERHPLHVTHALSHPNADGARNVVQCAERRRCDATTKLLSQCPHRAPKRDGGQHARQRMQRCADMWLISISRSSALEAKQCARPRRSVRGRGPIGNAGRGVEAGHGRGPKGVSGCCCDAGATLEHRGGTSRQQILRC